MNIPFFKIGHRGAKGHAPENTLLSIQTALDMGVDMIEVDVHTCLTGEVVVIHDAKLERTTNGHGYVRQKSLEYLKSLDAGGGQRIPLLTEVLDLVDKRANVNIEIKGKFTIGPVAKVIRHYIKEHGWTYEHFIVSAFTRHKLKKLAKIDPNIRIGALLAYRPFGFVDFARKIGAHSVHLNAHLANPRIIEQAKKAGMKVYVWTVNRLEDIKRLKDYGVDGIFSDFPDRL